MTAPDDRQTRGIEAQDGGARRLAAWLKSLFARVRPMDETSEQFWDRSW